MFSGIIQTISPIIKTEKIRGSLFMTVKRPGGWRLKLGDSLATDGVCLTVAKLTPTTYTCELMPETLKRSSFGLSIPAAVNLEPALKFNGRLDGHLVLGHVDSVGRISKIIKRGRSWLFEISFPGRFHKLIAAQGSISIDGISLTVVSVKKNAFTVSLVDYTLQHTTLGTKNTGTAVNLEFDVIAKYLNRLSER